MKRCLDGLWIVALVLCLAPLSAAAQAGCLDASPQIIVIQSEAPPKVFHGVREIALSAERTEPRIISVTAFDGACKPVVVHSFDKLYNFAALLFVDLPQIGSSLIIEAQTFYCGSGAGLEPIIFAMRAGHLVEIAAPMLEHGNMSGYAFSTPPSEELSLVVWRAIWQGQEAHYSPHIFEVSTYSWAENEFRKARSQMTANKYSVTGDQKAQSGSPLSDAAVTMPASLRDPLPMSWDGRFHFRPAGPEPDCRPL